MNNRPNVLLLTVDTLRADRVGCYAQTPHTPNLDALAAAGVRFGQAITGGSWTQAAFPTILTSTYASMYGGCLSPLSTARPSPVDALARHGYTTAGFSTSPLLSRDYGYDRGFDEFFDLIPSETDPLLRAVRGGQRLLRWTFTHRLAFLFGKNLRPAPLYVSAEEVTNRVRRWLDKAQQPFFLWAHYMDVHWPYHLPHQMRDPDDIAQAWRDLGQLNRTNRRGERLPADLRERYIKLYEQTVYYTDQQLGRLFEHLQARNLLENTIIIVLSDHGEEFLERNRWGHFESNLYDEILRVPLIIHVPGLSRPRVVSRQVRTLDIMPTVLDLCACPPPPRIEGSSLAPLWGHGDGIYEVADSLSELWRPQRHLIALRTAQYKYIWNSRFPDRPQLYDLLADPAERHDLLKASDSLEKPDVATLVRTFQARIDAHLRRVHQATPLTNGTPGADTPELDENVRRRLRGLGYLQ